MLVFSTVFFYTSITNASNSRQDYNEYYNQAIDFIKHHTDYNEKYNETFYLEKYKIEFVYFEDDEEIPVFSKENRFEPFDDLNKVLKSINVWLLVKKHLFDSREYYIVEFERTENNELIISSWDIEDWGVIMVYYY